jgi:glutamine synthetase
MDLNEQDRYFLTNFITQNKITEVECLVPDLSGIARGKILPAKKFIDALQGRGLRIPEAIFVATVTGEYPDDEDVTNPQNIDVYMVPDAKTIRLVPWYKEPTAQVICDCVYSTGNPVDISVRYILRKMMDLYSQKGWQAVVAPELEFYLVAVNKDPDYPLEPPVGRSGRKETGSQGYGIDAVNEFDPIFEDIYAYCETQNIDVDTLNHEVGAAQIEINFNHGDPMELADQVFLFKRTARQVAFNHNVYCTFMAKPMKDQPGSAMHIHQSVIDAEGTNLFATPDGQDTSLFMAHLAGLQKFLPAVMPLIAPNVNSFRRLRPNTDAPINVHWGRDNRTAGLRVPLSDANARRVENRLAGADANPYLAIAASMACGYLGMINNLTPTPAVTGSAHRLAFTLPRHQFDALTKLSQSKPLMELLGERFIKTVDAVRGTEYDAYQQVISSWEREYLLLNV